MPLGLDMKNVVRGTALVTDMVHISPPLRTFEFHVAASILTLLSRLG